MNVRLLPCEEDVNSSALIAAGAASAALGGYMSLIEPQRLQVTNLELAFPNLPPDFDGYTLLHLCDFHVTRFGRLERRTMRLIGSRPVDACMITGDVTTEPRASDVFRRVCSAVDHRDPIFMTLGNSERKPWLDPEALIEALSFEGLHMLTNSSQAVVRGCNRIVIAGVDDAYSGLDDVQAALEDVDPNEFIIFLTHCPSVTPSAIARGADLVLAGHTHGGQVRIPGLPIIYTHMRANAKLNDGLYPPERLGRVLGIDAGHSVLFVSCGIGMSRLRIRLFCPPEISFITLRRSQSPAACSR